MRPCSISPVNLVCKIFKKQILGELPRKLELEKHFIKIFVYKDIGKSQNVN